MIYSSIIRRPLLSVCLFCLLSVTALGQNATPTPLPQVMFVNSDSVFDIGGLPAGTSMEFHFIIKNVGNAPLEISDMKSDGKNIVCDWPRHLKPGKKATITLTYNAHGDNGSFKNEVYFTSNATPAPYPYLHISGAIIPEKGSYTPSSKPSSGKGGRRGH